MHRKIFLAGLFFLFLLSARSQNKQVLYGFNGLPQSLMLNPGAEVDFDKHFGIPLLSNVYLAVGATHPDVTFNNVMVRDQETGELIETEMMRNIYDMGLDDSDYFKVNQQIELLNLGFRASQDIYLSFGWYEEIDGYASYPAEPADMFYYGDYERGGKPLRKAPRNFNNLAITGEFIGVLHAGISYKVSPKFNFGVRLKLLSGSININSKSNTGSYKFEDGTLHRFYNMGLKANTSGLIDINGNPVSDGNTERIKGLFFMNGNFGLGMDLGMTYHYNERIVITASVLDLDYISYTYKTTKYNVRQDFDIDDKTPFSPTEGEEYSYWERVLDLSDIEDSSVVPIEVSSAGYNVTRTPKIFASTAYSFPHKGKDNDWKSIYPDARYVTYSPRVYSTDVGVQTYTAFRKNHIVWAATLFVEHDFNKYVTSKLTYTYDQFSNANFGLGVSSHFRGFNLFLAADNLVDLFRIKDSNYQSFQLGMNFMF